MKTPKKHYIDCEYCETANKACNKKLIYRFYIRDIDNKNNDCKYYKKPIMTSSQKTAILILVILVVVMIVGVALA